MRVLFFGSGAFGLPTLERLAKDHSIVGVVTQPDRPAGRSLRPTPTPIGEWTAAHLVPDLLLKPGDVNESPVASRLRSIDAEAWVVIAFGQKLGRDLLAGRFALNLHASLLPRWRGAAPIHHAVLAGDSETGNSVITLAEKMDAGLILAQSRRTIGPTMTTGELHDLLSADGPELILQVLRAQEQGAISGRPQDPLAVTRAPKLGREDAYVDFLQAAELCRRRINGLSPWPGVSVGFRSRSLKLLRAEALAPDSQETSTPGMILSPEAGVLACAQGTRLRVLDVQPAGGRPMGWPEFARGQRVSPGEILRGGAPC